MICDLTFKFCSSLTKIFPTQKEEPEAIPSGAARALAGEVFSFQLAYHASQMGIRNLKLDLDGNLKKWTQVRCVENIPVEYFTFVDDVEAYPQIPGLFPEILRELRDFRFRIIPDQWKSLWFTVRIPEDASPGIHSLELLIGVQSSDRRSDEQTISLKFELEILPFRLPKQKLLYTDWFHTDCLASYYQVPVFSEKHWEIIENFLRCATEHGMNMLYTPLFTPPLDTDIGLERPTTQLIGVSKKNGIYQFEFSKLGRWFDLGLKYGIRRFEMSHLFSQWGGKYTPKIVMGEGTKEKRIFGWEVEADSSEYKAFLAAFLPALGNFIRSRNLENNVCFHCTDEPKPEQYDQYFRDYSQIKNALPESFVLDAVENSFYREHQIGCPIVSTEHLEDFLEHSSSIVSERWTYYCMTPALKFSNRFIHIPSYRVRILGIQLYYYGISGFLHWGFNFYYATGSRYIINPYFPETSGYPAGDSYIVYPGINGVPEDSIRHEVFYEGIQDQRLMELLEQYISRSEIEKLLLRYSPLETFSLTSFPNSENEFLNLRNDILDLLMEHFEKQSAFMPQKMEA